MNSVQAAEFLCGFTGLLRFSHILITLCVIENDVRCDIKIEDLKCGAPVEFYKSSPNIEYNCNKELEATCEVSCKNGFHPTSDQVKCTLDQGKISWSPATIMCKRPESDGMLKLIYVVELTMFI